MTHFLSVFITWQRRWLRNSSSINKSCIVHQGWAAKGTASLFSAAQAACVAPPDHFMAGVSPTSARPFKIICLLYLANGAARLSGGPVQKASPPFINTYYWAASPRLPRGAAGRRGVILQTGNEAQGDLVTSQESHRKAMSAPGIKPHSAEPQPDRALEPSSCLWPQQWFVLNVHGSKAARGALPERGWRQSIWNHTPGYLDLDIWFLTLPLKKRGLSKRMSYFQKSVFPMRVRVLEIRVDGSSPWLVSNFYTVHGDLLALHCLWIQQLHRGTSYSSALCCQSASAY